MGTGAATGAAAASWSSPEAVATDFGSESDIAVVRAANPAAVRKATSKPVRSITPSPMIGPMPSAGVQRDEEVARRLGMPVAGAEVGDERGRGDEQRGPPMPVSPRSTSSTGIESTNPYSDPLIAASVAPPAITVRRP